MGCGKGTAKVLSYRLTLLLLGVERAQVVDYFIGAE